MASRTRLGVKGRRCQASRVRRAGRGIVSCQRQAGVHVDVAQKDNAVGFVHPDRPFDVVTVSFRISSSLSSVIPRAWAPAETRLLKRWKALTLALLSPRVVVRGNDYCDMTIGVPDIDVPAPQLDAVMLGDLSAIQIGGVSRGNPEPAHR